jgi:hypothetical protein
MIILYADKDTTEKMNYAIFLTLFSSGTTSGVKTIKRASLAYSNNKQHIKNNKLVK